MLLSVEDRGLIEAMPSVPDDTGSTRMDFALPFVEDCAACAALVQLELIYRKVLWTSPAGTNRIRAIDFSEAVALIYPNQLSQSAFQHTWRRHVDCGHRPHVTCPLSFFD